MKGKQSDMELPIGREGLEKRIFSMLGLARKAGFAQGGEFLAEKAVKSFKAHMLIVAVDASDNTKKKFRDMCTFYEVPCYEFGDKDSLGRALGYEMRASVAIKDAGMSKKLMELLDSLDKE